MEPPANGSGPTFPITSRTALKRHPERGSYDRTAVLAVLDEAFVAHVGVVVDGVPRVVPTTYGRLGDRLYVHGARANRTFHALASGAPACITVDLLDGLVFARSWFHHSMNFRSVMIYGEGAEVGDPDEKLAALRAIVDKAAPGRAAESRPPTAEELGATLAIWFPIEEASLKLRTGPPIDADQPAEGPWIGVLPLRLSPLPAWGARGADPGVCSTPVGERARRLADGAAPPYERHRGELVVSTDPARIDFDFVHRFLAEESYWAPGLDPDRLRQAMAHSLSFGLFRGDAQVGFARVVTDYGRIAYLGDVFVTRDARGQGLGRWLVETVLDHPGLARVERWILGTADAQGLYERFGFVSAEPGRYMVRRR